MKKAAFILFLFTCYHLAAQQRNDSLIQQLDSIRSLDQEYRGQQEIVRAKFANDTIELTRQIDMLFKKMAAADSANMIAIEQILEKYGWPSLESIGGLERSLTIFFVIQHADLPNQQRYLPMVRQAVKDNKLRPSSLALLEDRVALKEKRKQLYGTQVMWNIKLNTYTMTPLEDPDNVDKRRAAIGLPPLDVYLQGFNMKWDLEAYKKSVQLSSENNTIK
ncbi:MAG: hypothetical protein J0I41_16235 [Filimonas sp.]|nr:hypothetical protein [Filimonas sp.]